MSNHLTLNEFRKRFKVVNPLDLAAEERYKYYDPFVEGDAPRMQTKRTKRKKNQKRIKRKFLLLLRYYAGRKKKKKKNLL